MSEAGRGLLHSFDWRHGCRARGSSGWINAAWRRNGGGTVQSTGPLGQRVLHPSYSSVDALSRRSNPPASLMFHNHSPHLVHRTPPPFRKTSRVSHRSSVLIFLHLPCALSPPPALVVNDPCLSRKRHSPESLPTKCCRGDCAILRKVKKNDHSRTHSHCHAQRPAASLVAMRQLETQAAANAA